jgi:hypothetical protein
MRATMLLLVLLTAAACSTKAVQNPSATAASTAAPTLATEAPTTASPTASPAMVTREVTGTIGFQSPSGNIRCDMFGRNDAGYSLVRCEATSHAWTVPPRPANGGCTGDWYGRLIIDENRAFFGCASEALATGGALPYGHALHDGSNICESSEQGIKCTSQITGHGFTLSKQAYTLY